MRFLDSMLCVMLAAVIHQTDAGVVRTARRCLNQTSDKSDRMLLSAIISSKSPLVRVKGIIQDIPDEVLIMPASSNPHAPQVMPGVMLSEPHPVIAKKSPLAVSIKLPSF